MFVSSRKIRKNWNEKRKLNGQVLDIFFIEIKIRECSSWLEKLKIDLTLGNCNIDFLNFRRRRVRYLEILNLYERNRNFGVIFWKYQKRNQNNSLHENIAVTYLTHLHLQFWNYLIWKGKGKFFRRTSVDFHSPLPHQVALPTEAWREWKSADVRQKMVTLINLDTIWKGKFDANLSQLARVFAIVSHSHLNLIKICGPGKEPTTVGPVNYLHFLKLQPFIPPNHSLVSTAFQAAMKKVICTTSLSKIRS